jgi:glycosyltransferase involved in cell wall biosynthesis
LRHKLSALGTQTTILHGLAGPIRIRRNSGALAALLSIPAVLGLALRLARQARHYDLIYANSQKAFIVSAIAARLTGRKLVWHLHDILTADHFGPTARRAALLAAKVSRCAIIANSHATARALIALGGAKLPISVIHQGIDETPFAAVTQAQIAQLRAALGGETHTYIGLFSRLAPWKGQKLFLQAIAQLPGAIAVIAGDGLFGESDYARELETHIASLGLRDRVRLLGFRDDVPALMRAMDVIVHASTAPEPFGRVVVEGMLARRPVVASASGGVLEILEDGRTGFLFAPGDAGALAAVLQRILAAPDRGESVAQAGQDHARRHFALDAANEQVHALIS